MSEEKRRRAIEALEQSLDGDRRNAHVHAELAELYMQEGSLTSRIQADRHLQRALRIDPDHVPYRVQYGRLKRMQGFHHAARGEFKKALEIDPRSADAYYHLGAICEEEVLHFRDMIDGPIRFERFAENNEWKAIDYFRKALQIDPSHRDALFHLGLICCEGGEYEEMAGLYRKILDTDPDDKNARLFLGLALYRQEEGEAAWEAFEMARGYMTEDERLVFESIENLLNPEERKQNQAAPAENRDQLADRFWDRQDPLFLTEYNERILEHYS
ncbi:MAG: tetratricopeptide repeat protein, partial [Deltaproteobacteria bacterium]|nr:tetratricopeptide repeat protein [Deltaproteobacteria bacterium]